LFDTQGNSPSGTVLSLVTPGIATPEKLAFVQQVADALNNHVNTKMLSALKNLQADLREAIVRNEVAVMTPGWKHDLEAADAAIQEAEGI
jgi:hypothetical protein